MRALAHPGQELPFDAALAAGDRAPGWSRTAARRAARTARACRRCRNWTRPSAAILPSARSRSNASTVSRERNAPAPVQQIEIEAIGAQPLEAALAGGNRAFSAGVVRIHLADYKHLVAPAGDRARRRSPRRRRRRTSRRCRPASCRGRARASSAATSRRGARLRSPMRHVPRPSAGTSCPSGNVTTGRSARRRCVMPARIPRSAARHLRTQRYDAMRLAAWIMHGPGFRLDACHSTLPAPHRRPRRLPARLPRHLRAAGDRRERPRDRDPRRARPSADGRRRCAPRSRAISSARIRTERVLHPMKRVGRKGEGRFERISLGRGARHDRREVHGDRRLARRPAGDRPLLLRGDDGAAAIRLDGPALLPSARRVAARPHDLRDGRQGRLGRDRSARRWAPTSSSSTTAG